MFADPTAHPIASLLLSPAATISAAIVAAVAAIWGNLRAAKSARDLEEYKRVTNIDLERLKANLSHGQFISSTQWNAEFHAYQDLWKSIAPVRNETTGIALWEEQMDRLNLLSKMTVKQRLESIKERAKALDASLNQFSDAVQNYAPFYPQAIRLIAINIINPLRELTSGLLEFVVAHSVDGYKWGELKLAEWRTLHDQHIVSAFAEIEALEAAIRERLSSVRVGS